MFFHKKAVTSDVPQDEVERMTRKGLSDKDIIRQLKAKGYSYNAIEKAMLTAVKKGVDAPREIRAPEPAAEQAHDDLFGPTEYEPASVDDLFGAPDQNEMQNLQDLPEFAEQAQPVEELVEGLIEEKWQRLQDEMIKLEDAIERLKADIKGVEDKTSLERQQMPNDMTAHLTEMGDRLEDVEARIGGLERAFKQFLPSLTKNIESLSAMVAELKAHKPVEA